MVAKVTGLKYIQEIFWKERYEKSHKYDKARLEYISMQSCKPKIGRNLSISIIPSST